MSAPSLERLRASAARTAPIFTRCILRADLKCMKGITGRDGYIIAKALAYAIEAIGRLPEEWREKDDHAAMVMLFEDALTVRDRKKHLASARRHLRRGRRDPERKQPAEGGGHGE